MSSISLTSLIREGEPFRDLTSTTPGRIVEELLLQLAESEGFGSEVPAMKEAILGREREATTGIGHGVAIPHLKDCSHVSAVRGVFGRSAVGIDWAATDNEPVRLFFLILTPPDGEREHVRLMRRIMFLSRDRKTLQYLKQTEDFSNIREIFQEVDDQVQ